MSEINLVIAMLVVFGLAFIFEHFAVVVGRIIRAIGLSELDVRLKFHKHNTTTKQIKK